jgi:hypothetical protein
MAGNLTVPTILPLDRSLSAQADSVSHEVTLMDVVME